MTVVEHETNPAPTRAELLASVPGFVAKTAVGAARREGQDRVEDRQAERGGLAGSGLGDALQIAPEQHVRNGLRLDRRGRGVALGDQRLQDGRGEAEVGKVRHDNK